MFIVYLLMAMRVLSFRHHDQCSYYPYGEALNSLKVQLKLDFASLELRARPRGLDTGFEIIYIVLVLRHLAIANQPRARRADSQCSTVSKPPSHPPYSPLLELFSETTWIL